MADRQTILQEIYDEQGGPGAESFRQSVLQDSRDLHITVKEAREFVAKQSIGQVFQGYIPSDGKIAGGGRDDQRWQMDLIDFAKKPQKVGEGTQKFVLVAVDNFDRTIFTEPQSGKGADVTFEAFKKIIAKNGGVMPKQITVDNGNEYNSLPKYIEERGGVLTRKNMHAVNTLAVVDRVIGKLKVILSREKGFGREWASNLQKATKAYNSKPHTYLMETKPEDVKNAPLVQYELEKSHGYQVRHNTEKWQRKHDKLEDEKALRIPKPRDDWEHVDKPKWRGEVYNVTGFQGANVQATDAKGDEHTFPVKTSLAVPRGSAELDLGEVETNPREKDRQREGLQEYATKLRRLIPPDGLSLGLIITYLKDMDGFESDMDQYGFKGPGGLEYTRFIELFKTKFWIDPSTKKHGIRVYKKENRTGAATDAPIQRRPAAPRPAAPVVPRPVQVGGASSSGSAGGGGLGSGAPGIPRGRYQKRPEMDADRTIKFRQDISPGTPGSARYENYQKYKSALTIGRARRLGATNQALTYDERDGFLTDRQ